MSEPRAEVFLPKGLTTNVVLVDLCKWQLELNAVGKMILPNNFRESADDSLQNDRPRFLCGLAFAFAGKSPQPIPSREGGGAFTFTLLLGIIYGEKTAIDSCGACNGFDYWVTQKWWFKSDFKVLFMLKNLVRRLLHKFSCKKRTSRAH